MDGGGSVGSSDGVRGQGAAGGQIADGEHVAVAAVDGCRWLGVIEGPDATRAVPGDVAVEAAASHRVGFIAGQVQQARQIAARERREVVVEGRQADLGAEEREEIEDGAAADGGARQRLGTQRHGLQAITWVIPAALPVSQGGGGDAERMGAAHARPPAPLGPADAGQTAAAQAGFLGALGALPTGTAQEGAWCPAVAGARSVGQEAVVGGCTAQLRRSAGRGGSRIVLAFSAGVGGFFSALGVARRPAPSRCAGVRVRVRLPRP